MTDWVTIAAVCVVVSHLGLLAAVSVKLVTAPTETDRPELDDTTKQILDDWQRD
jgi:hypothetical protein